MRNRIDAAAWGVGVFAFLYLGEGMRLFAGYSWWNALIWPALWARPWWSVFALAPYAAVALLVYRLRLQGLLFQTPVVPFGVHDTPIRAALHANAALTAVAVFLGLYLAVGVGLGRFSLTALTWPYAYSTGMFGRPVAVAIVLASFAVMSLFVYFLKLAFLAAADDNERLEKESSQARLLQSELTACREAVALLANADRASPDSERELTALRGKVKILQANLENETRQSAQARMRAAKAEKKLREMANAGGGSQDSELDALRAEIAALRGNLENETHQAAQARMRAAEAEAELRKMKQKAGGPPPRDEAPAGKGGDKKFTRAKRAFSKMYHPDRIQADGFEKMIRTEFYKEFYQVLEAIDDDKPLP